jgi:PKD repeat protein
MSFKAASPLLGALVAGAALLSGCAGRYESDFPVVVVNHTVNPLQVLANGGAVGDVDPGQTQSFTLQLPESNANVFSNGVAPTPQARVTFAAKDKKTGTLSEEKSLTISQNSPTYVTFSADDFPSAVPTVARFTFSPVNAGINQDISFNASSSSVSGGTFAWDFGDAQSGTGQTTTHRYTRAAVFTIVLTVTNDRGQSSSASRTVNVSGALPAQSANFTFSPTQPAINQDVLFTAGGAAAPGFPGGPGGAPAPGGGVAGTYAWTFGDGGTSSGATATHRFTRAGNFTVTLRVSNDFGQATATSRVISVSATLPATAVSFTFSPATPGVNDTVFFNALSSTVANASYSWDYGDGTNGSGATPTHRFERPGTYSVTMTARNDLGQTASTSRSITVSAASTQLVADFTFSPTNPTLSLNTNSVRFDATDSSPSATEWAWDYGDGSTDSGRQASHTFSRAGNWVVRLTITDANGRTATTTKTVPVLAVPPSATP